MHLIGLLLLGGTAPAATVTSFSDDFNSYGASLSFSGNGGWTSAIPTLDPWTSNGTTVGPVTNNWTGGWGGGGYTDNHLVQTGGTYGDFTFNVEMLAADDDSIGVTFRYQDSRNFYLAHFTRNCYPAAASGRCLVLGTGGRLYRVVGGVGTQIASVAAPTHVNNVWHRLEVVANGSSISVSFDGSPVMSATDTQFTTGNIGLYSFSVGGARFDNVVLTQNDADNDTVVDENDNCVNDFNTGQGDQDSDGIGNQCDSDRDGDGIVNTTDCDDTDASVGGPGTWYTDADGDGYGDPSAPQSACTQPAGTVTDTSDCLDNDGAVNPAGTELCSNGLDDDCSGFQDDNPSDPSTFYADSDADSFGDPATSTTACTQPAGFVSDNTDCLDSNAAVNPLSSERCSNGLDDDCSGSQDDNPTDPTTWYADSDGDSYGDVGATTSACTVPPGYSADATDCDDGNAAVNPLGTEACNGLDDDCEGSVDGPDAIDVLTWYIDGDGDGHGVGTSIVAACNRPGGFADTDTDCDDSDPLVHPGASEQCDGNDSDCNGTPDDGVVYIDWWPDLDGDLFGDNDATPVNDCTAPPNHTDIDGDCDDSDAFSNPFGTEECDGKDNNCDGSIDEGGVCDTPDTDTDTDTDTDADTDTDTDTDSDADADTDTDTDTGWPDASDRGWQDRVQDTAVQPMGSGCSCDGSGSGGWAWGLLVLVVMRTRRR